MIWQQIFQFPTAPPPPTAVPLPLHMGSRHVRCFSFIICLISSRIQVLFSFLFCAFSYLVEPYRFVLSLAHGARGEIKKMQKRRKPPRRRTSVRQRRFSAVEKADNYLFGEIRWISSVVLIRMEKMIWQQIFQFPTAPPPPTAVPLPLHMGSRHVRCFSFIICLISSRIQVLFSFLFCAFSYLVEPYRFVLSLAHGARGEIKKMQKRRKPPRRRTSVRQRRFSAVEKADNYLFGEIR